MTRDEIRGLIGGYATGSLTEAERKALFEAALEDQELFDELAREQALKELLDEPGVKARMLAALAPRPRPMWARAWVWAAAGSFAVAAIAGIVLLKTPPQQEKTQEIAQATAPAAPVPPPIVAPAAVPPPVVLNQAAPAVPAPALKKTPPPAEPAAPVASQGAVTATAEASLLKTESAPAPPAAQAAQAGAQSTQDSVTVAAERAFGGVPAAAGRGGRGGGGGGGVGGNLGANRIVASPQAAVAPVRFAFDYSVTPQGILRIVPASNGFLTVGANNGSTLSTLFNSRSIKAGSVTEVPLPADCVSALVIFSAREMPGGFQNVTSPPDAPSGSKSDPNPTPDSVLIAMVPVKR